MVRLENVLDQGERPCRLHCRLQRGLISRLAGVFFFFYLFSLSLTHSLNLVVRWAEIDGNRLLCNVALDVAAHSLLAVTAFQKCSIGF